MMPDPTPTGLVEALHRGESEARAHLVLWFRDHVVRLIDRLIARHRLRLRSEVLVDRTLHWLEVYLRSRDPSDFTQNSQEVFRTQLLVAASKMLNPPAPKVGSMRVKLKALFQTVRGKPLSSIRTIGPYSVRTYTLPFEQVGGDWSSVDAEGDRSLWILVADVTAHGYPAYITASGLPYLWRTRRIAERRSRGCPPGELLDALSRELEPVLPDAVFVEASLAHFTPTGRVGAAGAGNCRVVLRRSGHGRFDFHRLGGSLLGLGGGERDQRDWELHAGDELTLASDGLFEQPDGDCRGHRLEASMAGQAEGYLAAGRALHDAVLDPLKKALGECPQHDDLTVLPVRFNGEAPAGRGSSHATL